MLIPALLLAVVLALAYANGANDNFKGVATIYGSGTASYRRSLAWATVTTACGSMLALVLAGGLVKTFSGNGLVPSAIASSPQFGCAVALGAASTVAIATRLGLPISTTHALTGALLGCGFVVVGGKMNFGLLGRGFFVPLLVSPILALSLSGAAYPIAKWLAARLGIEQQMCICVGSEWVPAPAAAAAGAGAGAGAGVRTVIAVGAEQECAQRYQ